jgi:hypothetical protein
MNVKTLLIISSASIFLVGCGGSSTVKPTADQTFSDLTYGTQYEFDSVSQSFSHTRNSSETHVTSLNIYPQSQSGSSLTYGSTDEGVANYVNIKDNATSVDMTFSVKDGDTFTSGIYGITAANKPSILNATEDVIFINPSLYGWEYQTYGFWNKDVSGASGHSGLMSIGVRTPNTSIPINGSASYTGKALGYATNINAEIAIVDADIKAIANFNNKTVELGTFNTYVSTVSKGRFSDSSMNSTGVLTYFPTSGIFTGNMGMPYYGECNASIFNCNGATYTLNGPAVGSFYGPNAEEIGGVIQIDGNSQLSKTVLSFGAKR